MNSAPRGDALAQPKAAQKPKHMSHSISLARVICVFGIVYVHAWTGRYGVVLERLASTPEGILRAILMEGLGRSAVPLLGMISGWLVAGSSGKRSYGQFLSGKAQTILLPMVLWNILSIIFVSGAAWMGWIEAPIPAHIGWVLDEIFCAITPNDINVQTYFLRDLFLCMAAAPFLLKLSDRWLVVIGLVAAAWAISGINFPLLLRPPILLFFCCGMLARRHNFAKRVGGWNWLVASVPFLAILAIRIPIEIGVFGKIDPRAGTAIDLVLRLAAAVFFWRTAWGLADRWVGRKIRKLEPYVFLTFCSHLILLWLLGPAVGSLTGPLGSSPAYAVFFLLQPVAAFAFAILFGKALGMVAPDLVAILSGGRLHSRRTETWAPDGRAAERTA